MNKCFSIHRDSSHATHDNILHVYTHLYKCKHVIPYKVHFIIIIFIYLFYFYYINYIYIFIFILYLYIYFILLFYYKHVIPNKVHFYNIMHFVWNFYTILCLFQEIRIYRHSIYNIILCTKFSVYTVEHS